MKAKLDSNGRLEINKLGKGFIIQYCPYDARSIKCGTWCPLIHISEHTLTLCNGSIIDVEWVKEDEE